MSVRAGYSSGGRTGRRSPGPAACCNQEGTNAVPAVPQSGPEFRATDVCIPMLSARRDWTARVITSRVWFPRDDRSGRGKSERARATPAVVDTRRTFRSGRHASGCHLASRPFENLVRPRLPLSTQLRATSVPA